MLLAAPGPLLLRYLRFTGFLGWLRSINKVDDSTLHTMVGMDHYVLLRHCLLGFNLTLL